MPSPGCEHKAPGVSGLLVGIHVERDALLNSGSETLIFAEGFGQNGFPRTRQAPCLLLSWFLPGPGEGWAPRDALLVALMNESVCSSSVTGALRVRAWALAAPEELSPATFLP